MCRLVILAALVAVTIPVAHSARIIGIFMTPSYSHQVVFQPIWKELSLQGHEVTVITPNPLNDPTLTNLTEIDIGEISYESWKKSSLSTLGMSAHSTMEELKAITKAYIDVSHVQLSHPVFQKLIHEKSKEKYDLFLVEYLWPTMYPFKDIFDCPMVGIVSLPLLSSAYVNLGIPRHPVLDPDYVLPFSTDLTFKERITSTLFTLLNTIGGPLTLKPKINAVTKQYFGDDVRDYREIAKEVSLVIANSNLATQNVKLGVPQLVEISGIHIKPKKPLPKDLQKILDDATEGVIYFSLGSNVKSSQLPKEKIEEFMNAFVGLPYKVLWKFETDDIPNLPKNVVVRKWLPQQDVLGHPNVKLFITQGGLQSIDEALANKVPVLTIPFFGDQRFNSDRMFRNGGGLMINFHSFTSEEMREKILTLLTDKRYQEKINQLSEIAFDHPMSPVDKAVWHINYVLRHKGADHLRHKAVNMPWYQFQMLDVYAVLVISLAIILTIISKITFKVFKGVKSVVRSLGIMTPTKKKVL